MSGKPTAQVGGIAHGGTVDIAQLCIDLKLMAIQASGEAAKQITMPDGPCAFVQIVPEFNRLDVHRDIAPFAPKIVEYMVKHVPALKGSSLKLCNGFGAETMMFEAATPDALRVGLRELIIALDHRQMGIGMVTQALADMQKSTAGMGV